MLCLREISKNSVEEILAHLHRWIDNGKIGSSIIQSRAAAYVTRGANILALPGSNGAVTDSWDQFLVHLLDGRFRPCNFVELMPRLLVE